VKLHLGCGERYLDGYFNIDFPVSEHTVQRERVADLYADILTLRYAPGEAEEIRLHHVFEHFARPVACALLASWFSWLRTEGILHIEVPDFDRTARLVTRTLTSLRAKSVAERHLFGSHEAEWADHREGYNAAILRHMVRSFGFVPRKLKRNSWKGTHNLELVSDKSSNGLSRGDFERIAAAYLSNFLLDDSASEKRLLEVWMEAYRRQAERGWAAGGCLARHP
jgi:predicted SAM-dependent methyltransferase